MRLRISLGLLVALMALLFPAVALADHQYLESFGPDGTEGTQFTNALPVTIDQSDGTIYVASFSTESIYKFDQAHQPSNFSALGSNQITGVPIRFLSQLAVDSASHRIYATSHASLDSIRAFQASGEPAEFPALGGASEITGFETLCGVAVDSNGDIYAADLRTKKVSVYAPSGAKLTEFAVEDDPPGASSGPCNLAVDSAGDVYVTHVPLSAEPQFTPSVLASVQKFTPSSSPVTAATTYSSAGTVDPGPDVSLTVNPATGHLYVVRREQVVGIPPVFEFIPAKVVEYDAAGNEVPPPFGDTEPGELTRPTGIVVKGSGLSERIYVSDPLGQSRVEIFGPQVTPPDVNTGEASEVKKTSATLEGTLNPKEFQVTQCSFEYATNVQYQPQAVNPYAAGGSAPCDSLDGSPISGPGEIPADGSDHLAAADISALAPNTTYHFRFAAANAAAGAVGKDATFETLGPPVISKELASEIDTDSALITGQIDPRGEETTFAVEYVTQAQFEAGEYAEATSVPVPPEAVGSGVGAVEVSQELSGLIPGTDYHFRLVADNSVDPPVHGEDLSFATFALPNIALPDGRAYEMVTPPIKSGEVFSPDSGGSLNGSCTSCMPGGGRTRMPMQPSSDGNAIAYEGQAFGPGMAAELNEYLGGRGPEGWATEAISKPEYGATLDFNEQFTGYRAFSTDLSRGVFLQRTPTLSPQAPPGHSDLYLWQRGEELTPLLTQAPPQRPPNGFFHLVYAAANAGAANAGAFTHIVFEANDALTAEVPGLAPAAPEITAAEANPNNGDPQYDLYEWVGGELRLINVLPGNAAAHSNAVIGAGRLTTLNHQNDGPDFDHAISDDGSRIFWTDVASKQTYVRIDGERTKEIPDSGAFLTAASDGSKVLLNNGHVYDLEDESTADLSEGQGGFQGILGAAEDLSRVYFVDTAVLSGTEENANEEAAEEGKPNLYLSDEGEITFIGRLLAGDNFTGGELAGAWRPGPSSRTAQVSPDGRYATFLSQAELTGYDNTLRHNDDFSASQVFEYDAAAGKLICASCNPSGERPLGRSNLSLIWGPVPGNFINVPRNLTAKGRLFFESLDTLSVADKNGRIQDVYEFEPQGVGSCERAKGCVSLISSGKDPGDTHFLGASSSGDDVFIVTRAQLLPRDTDDFVDLYDARVGGGFSENFTPPCGGEACRGAIPPVPASQSPGSASFSGLGNEAQKPKKHKHKKKRKQKKHSKRAAKHNRGGSK